jgi:hypothetical protein
LSKARFNAATRLDVLIINRSREHRHDISSQQRTLFFNRLETSEEIIRNRITLYMIVEAIA